MLHKQHGVDDSCSARMRVFGIHRTAYPSILAPSGPVLAVARWDLLYTYSYGPMSCMCGQGPWLCGKRLPHGMSWVPNLGLEKAIMGGSDLCGRDSSVSCVEHRWDGCVQLQEIYSRYLKVPIWGSNISMVGRGWAGWDGDTWESCVCVEKASEGTLR